jgi:hypothetical protein
MSDHRSPPPEAAACLGSRRPSSQKGGTIIAENVVNVEEHQRCLSDPDGYRPARCPSCRHDGIHAHDFRSRVVLAEPDTPSITVRVYQCTECGATWRVLPRFVARHLWRTWRTVEKGADIAPLPPSQPRIPERTRRRWRERLGSAARLLVQIFATSGGTLLESVARAAGLDATRSEVVSLYAAAVAPSPACAFADVAALVHRLEPGVRLV